MRRVLPWRAGLLAVGLLMLGLAGTACAADDKPPPTTAPDPKSIDQVANKVLHDVIDEGAVIYNSGDYNGCYRLFEGALITLRPFFDHHADWQKDIDTAVLAARTTPDVSERAWVIRREMDKIRAAIKAGAKPDDKPKTASLWDRLGGEEGVKKVVDDFVDLAAKDKEIDFFRGGKYKDLDVKHLKKGMVDLISVNTGGPNKYAGKDMKSVHKGMGITDAQFDACLIDLRKALTTNGVKIDDVNTFMTIFAGSRKEIVEPKEEKKPDDKKTDDKKD